jgi:hypothetical protein
MEKIINSNQNYNRIYKMNRINSVNHVECRILLNKKRRCEKGVLCSKPDCQQAGKQTFIINRKEGENK